MWGADMTGVLPRSAEAVARAAGRPDEARPGDTLTLDVGADTEAALVASVIANAVSSLSDDGFYVEAAACRAFATADEASGFEVRFAARLLCRGLLVDAQADPGLAVLAEDDEADVRVWREADLLRARFQLRRRRRGGAS